MSFQSQTYGASAVRTLSFRQLKDILKPCKPTFVFSKLKLLKKAILVMMLIAPFITNAQDSIRSVPVKDGEIFYEKVVQLDSSVSKEQLFTNAHLFFIKAFKSQKSAIEFEDKDAGKLLGNGNIVFQYGKFMDIGVQTVFHTFIVEFSFKDNGKYRIQLHDFKTFFANGTASPTSKIFGTNTGGFGGMKTLSYTDMVEKAKSGKKWAVDALAHFDDKVKAVLAIALETMASNKKDDF